jgi:hypothetical protein
LAKLYQGLSLPDFERFWQQGSVYLDSIAGYKKNTYTLTEEARAKAIQRWRFIFDRCDYPLLPLLDPGASVPLGGKTYLLKCMAVFPPSFL